jgi:hypothetical protein
MYHPEALELWGLCQNLKTVCSELRDPDYHPPRKVCGQENLRGQETTFYNDQGAIEPKRKGKIAGRAFRSLCLWLGSGALVE